MKYIVQAHLAPDTKNQLLDAFDQRGPNRIPGVKFLGAWVGTRSDVIFVLCESADEALVRQASSSWGEFSEVVCHPVVDVEQI